MPNGLIAEDSLRRDPAGFAVVLTIPWYRSLWLSSVTSIALKVDGEEVPAEDIRFVLNDVEYALDDLQDKSETLWYLQSHAMLRVRSDRPFELGEEHEVEILGELRLPYMQ